MIYEKSLAHSIQLSGGYCRPSFTGIQSEGAMRREGTISRCSGCVEQHGEGHGDGSSVSWMEGPWVHWAAGTLISVAES